MHPLCMHLKIFEILAARGFEAREFYFLGEPKTKRKRKKMTKCRFRRYCSTTLAYRHLNDALNEYLHYLMILKLIR